MPCVALSSYKALELCGYLFLLIHAVSCHVKTDFIYWHFCQKIPLVFCLFAFVKWFVTQKGLWNVLFSLIVTLSLLKPFWINHLFDFGHPET